MNINYIKSFSLPITDEVFPLEFNKLLGGEVHFKEVNNTSEDSTIALHQFWLSIFLRQQSQLKHLENICNTDDLTQLRNKRYFQFYLENCWENLAASQAPLSVIFLDIDNLKVYNLMRGQEMGDKCVARIANAISACVHKDGALVARYQDDTFALVLPYTTATIALELAEVIREEVNKLDIKHAVSRLGGLPFPIVTVSLGVACTIPKLEQSPTILVDAALTALHRAKKLEGNCSCVSKTLKH